MTTINIDIFTNTIQPDEHGIWVVPRKETISYPDQGNALCFELEDNSAWFQHRNRSICQIVAHYPPQGPIFDVGGGNGFVSTGLIKNGWNTVLVEPGLDGALNARKRGLENVICSTFQEAAFNSNSLPAIGLFDTLEHIEDSVGFLKELKDKLMPGGLLYVSVPAYNFLWATDDDYAGHYRRYTKRILNEELARAGFSTEFNSYLFAALVVPLFALRSLPYRIFGPSEINLEKVKQQHGLGKGILHDAIQTSFNWEIERLKNRHTIPFGTSCLAVARA